MLPLCLADLSGCRHKDQECCNPNDSFHELCTHNKDRVKKRRKRKSKQAMLSSCGLWKYFQLLNCAVFISELVGRVFLSPSPPPLQWDGSCFSFFFPLPSLANSPCSRVSRKASQRADDAERHHNKEALQQGEQTNLSFFNHTNSPAPSPPSSGSSEVPGMLARVREAMTSHHEAICGENSSLSSREWASPPAKQNWWHKGDRAPAWEQELPAPALSHTSYARGGLG